jgi:hypothetical protein
MPTDDELIMSVVSKIQKGGVVTKRELDIELKRIGMILLPLYEWKEVKKDAIAYYRTRLYTLEGDRKGHIQFTAGLLLGILGTSLFTNTPNYIFLIVSLIVVGYSTIRIYLTSRKIRGILLIQKHILPHIFVYGTVPLNEFIDTPKN